MGKIVRMDPNPTLKVGMCPTSTVFWHCQNPGISGRVPGLVLKIAPPGFKQVCLKKDVGITSDSFDSL